MDKNTKILLGVLGGVVVVGGITYVVIKSNRKKKKAEESKAVVSGITFKQTRLPVWNTDNQQMAEEVALRQYAEAGSPEGNKDPDQMTQAAANVMNEMFPDYKPVGFNGWPTRAQEANAFAALGLYGADTYVHVLAVVKKAWDFHAVQ